MKSSWYKAARAAYATLLLAALASFAMRVGNGVEPGMFALVDSSFAPDPQAAAATAAENARVVVDGTNWEDVVRGADVVREAFGAKGAGGDFLADVRGKTAGLLDQTTRSLILSNDFAAVRETAEARLFGIAPPLFSVKDDPMLLATAYMEGLHGAMAPGWTFRDGLPAKSLDGREYALVSLRFANSGVPMPSSVVEGPRSVAAAMDLLPEKMPPGVVAHFSGAAFHSARSASGAEREIAALSVVSLVLVMILGRLLFRSMSFVLPLAAALFAGVIAAAGALFAFHARPHVITFVFGTSLIGLSVDYVYHALAAGGARAVLRPLTQSFATTLVCFAPLLFADVVVLRQMALFAIAGLTAVYAGVVVFGGGCGKDGICPVRGRDGARPSRCGNGVFAVVRVLRFVLFAAASSGIFMLKTTSEPSAFYRPDAALAADEKKIAELFSMNGAKIVFTAGATLQESLEREEDAGVQNGLSSIVPSLRRQRENVGLVERLYAEEGAKYEEHTGIKTHCGAGLLDPEALPPESPLGAIVRTMWTGRGLIAPCAGSGAVSASGGSRFVATIDLREAVRGVFDRAMNSTWRLFVVSSAVLFVFLAMVFRRRMVAFVAPPAAALAATAGMLGWLGVPFTLFTLLSFFVILGLGLDYAIFHRSSLAEASSVRRTVLFAFLTSLVGLGMLSFTAFPVTHDMGLAFAFGLFFSYLASGKYGIMPNGVQMK